MISSLCDVKEKHMQWNMSQGIVSSGKLPICHLIGIFRCHKLSRDYQINHINLWKP